MESGWGEHAGYFARRAVRFAQCVADAGDALVQACVPLVRHRRDERVGACARHPQIFRRAGESMQLEVKQDVAGSTGVERRADPGHDLAGITGNVVWHWSY